MNRRFGQTENERLTYLNWIKEDNMINTKPLVLVTGPVTTRSGYGNHARDICQALIESDKYDVRINKCRWGNTPMNALEKGIQFTRP